MHPILVALRFGSRQFEVSSFGVLVALGCAVAIVYAVHQARRAGEDGDAIRDLGFWVTVASLLGARLAYVIANAGAMWEACLDGAADGPLAALAACSRPLRLWEGGLVFYGGLCAGVAMAWWYARRRGLAPLATLDRATPALALGHAVGRLGCFAAGCCFGKPAGAFIGLRFPPESVAFQDLFTRGMMSPGAERTPPLHATQLYEAAGEFVLFLVLARLARRPHRPGAIALTYLLCYAPLRFAVELFRGDAARGVVLPLPTPALNRLLGLAPSEPALLSTSQAAGLAIFALALAVWLVARRRPATSATSARAA